jgi:DNA-binding IclR family transcriptional regulator
VGGCSISELARAIDTPLTKLPRYLNPLSDADLILKKDGKYQIRDKILRDYLKFQLESLT